MRFGHFLLVVFIAGIVILSQPRLSAQATTQPAQAGPRILSEVNFQGITLEDAVSFLQDADPDFKVVVARDPRVPADFPLLKFRLRNVTAEEVLSAIVQAYDVRVKNPTVGKLPRIWAISVEPGPNFLQPNFTQSSPQIVRVISLTPLLPDPQLSANQNLADTHKHTLDDVMSLIQAVLDQTGTQTPEEPKPSLLLHKATSNLIVKGTPQQQDAVQQAINALTPTAEPPTGDATADLMKKYNMLELELKQTTVALERASEAKSQPSPGK